MALEASARSISSREVRLRRVVETLETIRGECVGPENLHDTYQRLSEVAFEIDACETDVGGMSGGVVGTAVADAYDLYQHTVEHVVAAVREPSFLTGLEAALRRVAGERIIREAGERIVVWHVDGCFPMMDRSRSVATYLTLCQVPGALENETVLRAVVPPSYLHADLLVQTPAWVPACISAATGKTYPSFEVEPAALEYLAGLWKMRASGGIERLVSISQKLARVERGKG